METKQPNNSSKTLWTTIGGIIALACIFGMFYFYGQNASLKNELENLRQEIQEQSKSKDHSDKANLIHLIDDIFGEINADLENSPKRVLKDKTISRILELNRSLQSDTDKSGANKWSVEQGHLLRRLASLNLDSNSFKQIKSKASFQGADLTEMDLRGLDLSGVNLQDAILKETNLNQVNLSYVNLIDANLWGANLQNCNLTRSTLHRADLSWADLTGADLRDSDLNGANLNDTKLGQAQMQSIKLEWAKARNVYLNGADLTEAALTGTDFGSSNLTKVNFTKAIMNIVNLSDAIVDEANFSNAELSKLTVLEKDWIETLKPRSVTGYNEIQDEYKTIIEPSGKYNFRLVKK